MKLTEDLIDNILKKETSFIDKLKRLDLTLSQSKDFKTIVHRD